MTREQDARETLRDAIAREFIAWDGHEVQGVLRDGCATCTRALRSADAVLALLPSPPATDGDAAMTREQDARETLRAELIEAAWERVNHGVPGYGHKPVVVATVDAVLRQMLRSNPWHEWSIDDMVRRVGLLHAALPSPPATTGAGETAAAAEYDRDVERYASEMKAEDDAAVIAYWKARCGAAEAALTADAPTLRQVFTTLLKGGQDPAAARVEAITIIEAAASSPPATDGDAR